MKKHFLILGLMAFASSPGLFAQSIIPEEELGYAVRYSWEEALEAGEPDSVFGISIWGENYDPTYISDSTQLSADLLKFRNLQILEITDKLAGEVLQHLDHFPLLQSLSLRNVGISDLPESFYSLKNLKQLTLQDMDGLHLHGDLLAGNNIHSLELVRVTSVCDSEENCNHPIEFFPHLTWFRLAGSEYQIPQGVFGLKEIVTLDFSTCNFSEIPAEIGNLTTLEELSFNSIEGLATLPDEMANLTSLRTLDIGSCAFEELPESLAGCESLESLWAGGNPLLEAPAWIGDMENLSSINISGGYIASIPEDWKNCESLTSVSVYSNTLIEFPKALLALPHLLSLDLSNNSITSIPSGLFGLTELTSLDLSGNPIASMAPDALNNATLSYLSLSRCGIKKLPDMSKLTGLYTLDLSDDSLTELPSSIFALQNLRELNLNFNQLTSLPGEGWEKMLSLGYFSLSYNQLKALPAGIYKSPSLFSLDATNNKLTKLPKGISKSQNLAILRLQGNKGIAFSKEIGSLKSLQMLQVGPEDMSAKNLAKLRKWIAPEKLEISEY